MGLLLGVVLACGATTANISSLKVSTDEQGKNEAKSFKPGDKVYAVAPIANNGGTVQTKFRILYDDHQETTTDSHFDFSKGRKPPVHFRIFAKLARFYAL